MRTSERYLEVSNHRPPGSPAQVPGEIEYISPASLSNYRYLAPDGELSTGVYDRHIVSMRNGRPNREQYTLQTHGFQLVDHRSAVSDFEDTAQIQALYRGEVETLLVDLTGADLALTFGWLWRDARLDAPDTLHPANDAHVDYTAKRGDRQARNMLAQAAPGFECRRIIGLNLWRTYSDPPQDWPLAVCDGATVGSDEGVTNTLCPVVRIPDPGTTPEPVPDAAGPMDGTAFHYNPGHQWHYFPDMTRDEALVFKLYDSTLTGAWRAPHTSFRDLSRPKANARKSLEIRAFVYFAADGGPGKA